MTIAIEHPDLEQFVRSQVEAGRFASHEQVVSAALSRLMSEAQVGEDLGAETVAAIIRANDQIDRGEVMTVEEVRQRFECEVFRKAEA
jgi:Arc/MetJ-type ribon-helix-helix transcriptional regulator